MTQYPHSDYLIAKFIDNDGDQLLIRNSDERDGDSMLTVVISCPHQESGKYVTLAVEIPVDVLDQHLDDLADEREGCYSEDGEEEASDE